MLEAPAHSPGKGSIGRPGGQARRAHLRQGAVDTYAQDDGRRGDGSPILKLSERRGVARIGPVAVAMQMWPLGFLHCRTVA
jgi:hypothetical protein